MNKIYSTDECNNINLFLKEIKKYKREGRIDWVKEDLDTYKIFNIDLDDDECEELSILFEEWDVYEVGIIEDDSWDPYYDEDEDYDDYFGSKKNKYRDDLDE
jgi:hypothetical protein